MDDPAEIAALCQEYVSSLDNVPHEVTHILKEIQHKDSKVHDLIPKIANRESQLREILNKGSPGAPVSAGGTAGSAGGNAAVNLNEQDKAKMEKLIERIRLDYKRADEWSAHKEQLSKRLWRLIFAHNKQLHETFAKIAPSMMSLAESTVASTSDFSALPATATGDRLLSAIASAFTGAGASEDAVHNGLKKKGSSHISLLPSATSSPMAGVGSALHSRPSGSTPSSSRRLGSNEPTTPAYLAETPSRGLGSQALGSGGSASNNRNRKSGASLKSRAGGASGLSKVFSAADPDESYLAGAAGLGSLSDADDSLSGLGPLASLGGGSLNASSNPLGLASGAGNGTDTDEKDENLYCFCQKVSYGEMIGCDSDDCKYEWFHLDCVGLSEPLPKVWYCSDCQARMKREKELKEKEKEAKEAARKEKEVKKEKEGSVGVGEKASSGASNKRRKKG